MGIFLIFKTPQAGLYAAFLVLLKVVSRATVISSQNYIRRGGAMPELFLFWVLGSSARI